LVAAGAVQCVFYIYLICFERKCKSNLYSLKVVTSEKIGGSGEISTLGTWYGGVVMGVLLTFNEAAILYRDFNCAPSQKQNIIVFAANNSRCCECHVAPTIIL
jgi:hypothetical protein